MQTLGRLRLSVRDGFEAVRYRLDEYLDQIVRVVNHNALDREWIWTLDNPVNGTYLMHIPNEAREVVGVAFALQAGTCDVDVQQGATGISWETAVGTTLGVTTTEQTDTASADNRLVADTAVKAVVANVSGAAGLCVSLRTGG